MRKTELHELIEALPHESGRSATATISPMPRVRADRTPVPAVIETNPGEDCSPEAFRIILTDVLAGAEPELDSVDAVEALRAIRADTEP